MLGLNYCYITQEPKHLHNYACIKITDTIVAITRLSVHIYNMFMCTEKTDMLYKLTHFSLFQMQ